MLVEADASSAPHHQLRVGGMLYILLGQCELFLEGAGLFPQRYNIRPWDGGVTGGVVIDALGIAPFAGSTSRDSGVASGFALRRPSQSVEPQRRRSPEPQLGSGNWKIGTGNWKLGIRHMGYGIWNIAPYLSASRTGREGVRDSAVRRLQ